jgi:hypothetical protein
LTKNGKPLIDEEGKLLATNGNNNVTQSMIEVTYNELKSLRDNSKLIAGQQYRITDYECTTIQNGTSSAGHRFDIIVTADSVNTLNENAKACINENDEYFRKVEIEQIINNATFKQNITYNDIIDYYSFCVDCDETEYNGLKPRDILIEIGYKENNKGIIVPVFYKTDESMLEDEGTDYNDTFFYSGTYELDGIVYDKWRKIEDTGQFTWDSGQQKYILTNRVVDATITEKTNEINSLLNNWEIKYCLDNDTNRFAWADNKKIPSIYTDDDYWFDYSGTITIEGITYHSWCNEQATNDFGVQTFLLLTNTNEVDEIPLNSIIDVLIDDTVEFEYSTVLSKSNGKGGKGVIYYMKDEYNNEAPYDFKNILFHNSYTFSFYDASNDILLDASIFGNNGTLVDDTGMVVGVRNNQIKEYVLNGKQFLNFNILNSDYNYEGGLFYGYIGNTFKENCYDNHLNDCCHYNYFIESYSNYFGTDILNNNFITFINSRVANYFERNYVNNVDDCSFGEYISNQVFTNLSLKIFENNYTKIELKDISNLETINNSQFINNLDLVSIYLKATKIGSNAFNNCSNLTNVSFNNLPVEIDSYAFANCQSLNYLDLPSHSTMGTGAFKGCKLDYIHIPAYGIKELEIMGFKNPNRKLYYDGTLDSWLDLEINNDIVDYLGVFGGGSFYIKSHNSRTYSTNYELVEDIILTKNVSPYSFAGCNSLKTVEFTKGLNKLSKSAFASCGNLKKVILPKTIVDIQDTCFFNCINLKKFHIKSKDANMYIGDQVFKDCWSYKPIIYFALNEKPTHWHKNALANVDYDTIYWGINETNLVEEEFADYLIEDEKATLTYVDQDVKELIIPSQVVKNGNTYIVDKIGYASLFHNSIENVTIPDSVTTIDKYAFCNCNNLKQIKLSNNLQTIDVWAFSNSLILNDIYIPSSVTEIKSFAFREINTSIDINTNNALVDFQAFYGCKLHKLTIPYDINYPSIHDYFYIDSCNILDIGGHSNTKIDRISISFESDVKLKTLIVRKTTNIINLDGYKSMDSNTKIYVSDNLVSQYKSATNWSNFSNQIYPLSEYVEED